MIAWFQLWNVTKLNDILSSEFPAFRIRSLEAIRTGFNET